MDISKRNVSQARRLSVKIGAGIAFLMLQMGSGLLPSAQAASFHCGKHMSASENAVCNDPELSKLDDDLAVVYKRALEAALDKQSIEEARMQQLLWRQKNCFDNACVKSWYERRIGELEADYDAEKKAQSDAFDANLAQQKLTPGAEYEVRKLKSRDAEQSSALAQ